MEEESSVFLRTITNRLLLACEKNNIKETSGLCLYLINLKLMQRCGKVLNDGADMDAFVEETVRDLKENPAWLKTLKLQLFWTEKYRTKDEIKRTHHETIYKNIIPILTEILEGSLIRTVDKENLYRKMVIFVIMFSGLGNPTDGSIIKETQAALCSIFKYSEIDNFMTLSTSTREQQLFEFARLVTGIRLFNKDCKKGGEGINDLPLILTQGVRATKDRIINFKNKVDKKIEHLVKTLSTIYFTDEEKTRVSGGWERSENLNELKSFLIYTRQTEVYLRDLLKDLDESLCAIDELVEKLQSILLQVHEVVRFRAAIATVQIFPLFLQLSNVWVEMQEEVDVLSEINNNFVELSAIIRVLEVLEGTVESPSNVTSEQSPLCDEGEIIRDQKFHPDVQISNISAVSGEDRLQYEGFCAWTLSQTKGVLTTGNISIGVLVFENRFYSFSSAAVASEWAKAPKQHIKTIFDLVRIRPDLIKLLNMADELRKNEPDEAFDVDDDDVVVRRIQGGEKKTTANVETQTEVHPVSSYINKDHTFSQWELKRRAIKLANLTKCVTKSQQTINSMTLQPEVGVQVTPTGNKETQTKRNVATCQRTCSRFTCKSPNQI